VGYYLWDEVIHD